MRRLTLLTLAAALAAGPAFAQTCPAPRFTVTDFKAGDSPLDRGFTGGVSLVDVDGDGDLDLMATRGYDTSPNAKPTGPDRSMLYLNDGKGNFSRDEASPLSRADLFASGSTWADIDNDGDQDVFVSTEVGRVDGFYRNLGGGRFEKQELGDATATKASNFTSTWADMDGDLDLDLYVGNPTLEPGEPAQIYRNDNGRFVRAASLPIDNGVSNGGAALWSDLDGDGDPDLVVVNSDGARLAGMKPADNETPAVWRNDGQWRFTRVSQPAFADAGATASNTAALGDVDNDGDLDLFTGAFADTKGTPRPDRLYRNDGHGVFSAAAGFPGVDNRDVSGGAAFADVDLDGDLDIVAGPYDQPLRLYLNDGRGGFALSGDPGFAARKATHAGVATGDLDGDGDIDAVIGDWGDTVGGRYMTLVRNDSAPCGTATEIRLVTSAKTLNPPNARVTLVSRAADGTMRRQTRESAAQTSFRSQSASAFLFGVPKGETAVRAEILWPDGYRETVQAPASGVVEVKRD